MLGLIEKLIGAVVRLFPSLSIARPAWQRIPVRTHISISRKRK
jgi:hypothetical protein